MISQIQLNLKNYSKIWNLKTKGQYYLNGVEIDPISGHELPTHIPINEDLLA